MMPFAYELVDPAQPFQRDGYGLKLSANLRRQRTRGPPSWKAGFFARLTSEQRP
jgi:hypothetical protein